VMARIRGGGNKDTELRMIALFRAHGITGWRRKQKLFGKPILCFAGSALRCSSMAVSGTVPEAEARANAEESRGVVGGDAGRNRERDLLVTKTLREAGWRVVRVWECDLAAKHRPRVTRRL